MGAEAEGESHRLFPATDENQVGETAITGRDNPPGLNTELVTKPKHLLEYVIAHEMAHLTEPTHSDRFIAIPEEHYLTWREARAEQRLLPN